MATGPEHYRKAEELLEKAASQTWGDLKPDRTLLATAQVHATLAQAAATAVGSEAKGSWLRAAWKNFTPGGTA